MNEKYSWLLNRSKDELENMLKKSEEEKYHSRVMIVGKRQVGKTTLRNRLLSFQDDVRKDTSNELDVQIRKCEISLSDSSWHTFGDSTDDNCKYKLYKYLPFIFV